ncbi:lysozyme inhibitor LprI family protein [Limnobacter sp.]|uniref:lysozyme inhibitor LprI family protein n=1 Tax=Limnobacter sp. TaxID=2003368 RepID=UPI0039C8C277
MLSNCDATQQSMYFCAWRDLLEAEQKLDALEANPENASVHCQKAIKNGLSKWRKQRDAHCKAQALQEFGEGSMGPTADLMCRAQATQDKYLHTKARAGRPCTKP